MSNNPNCTLMMITAFALWLNSLGVDPFVFNLYENLKDGLILLQGNYLQSNIYDNIIIYFFAI